MFDPSFLLDLSDKLGVIQAVKGKLLRYPDSAADKLVVVLEEISAIYEAIDRELSRYLRLSFEPGGDLVAERELLLTLEGRQLDLRVAEARGHCHKIDNIYDRYLNPWFDRALGNASPEVQALRQVFDLLGNMDDYVIRGLGSIANWIATQAQRTLNYVDAGQLDDANALVRAARKQVLPVRQKLTGVVVDLRNAQAEFITIAGIV